MDACTGHDQVTDTGQSVKGFRYTAHLDPQACDLSNSSGNQCRFRVVTVSQSVCHTGSQCDHIFQCTAQFHTKHIRCCVYTEDLAHENILQIFCRFSAVSPHNAGCRNTFSDFFCMARAGKHCHVCLRNLFFNDLRQCHQCLFFDPFCHIHDLLSFFAESTHTVCRASCEWGRNRQDQNIFVCHGIFKITGDINIRCQNNTRQFFLMLSFCAEHFYFFRDNRPDRHFMTIVVQQHCKCCPPCSGSDNTNFCHKKTPSVFILLFFISFYFLMKDMFFALFRITVS